MSESIEELMEGLDVNSSNDIARKEIKDFKKVVVKSINSYIKQKLKRKILKKEVLKKKILKRKVPKRKIPQKNILKRQMLKKIANIMLMINQLLMLILRHI